MSFVSPVSLGAASAAERVLVASASSEGVRMYGFIEKVMGQVV